MSTLLKFNPSYYERDPEKKDAAWATDIIGALRGEWRHIIDVATAARNMQVLLAEQDLESIKEYFKKGTHFTENTEWAAIAVLDRLRNILVAEFIKGAYEPNLEAEDVSADLQRKQDKDLLSNRSIIEAAGTRINSKIGDPPYKVPAEKYNGNMEQFDAMGLSSDNDEDILFYFKTFHRLYHEISGEKLCRTLMKASEMKNHVEDMVNDLLAKKAIAYQSWASPRTGEIKWRYLEPMTVKGIKGKKRNYKDAMCLGTEEMVTVRQFLEFAGPEFDFENIEDRSNLTSAVNLTGNYNFAYITSEGCWNYDMKNVPYISASYASLMTYNVGVGYIEWKSYDSEVKIKHKKTGFFYDASASTDVSAKSAYTKEVVNEYESVYKSWFLSTGTTTQKLFRFGRLYHMVTEGAADEYASYSLSVYVGTGKSAVNIARPFIHVVNLAFYKMLWGIAESLPRETIITYEAIASMIGKVKPQHNGVAPMTDRVTAGAAGMIDEILKMFTTSLTKVVGVPQIDGTPVPGLKPFYREEGGIDPIAIAMQTVMDWAEAQVSTRLGINSLRDAATPDPKDGLKLQQASLRQSQNATYYIPDAIQETIKHMGTTALAIAQDGIEHKTNVYDYLVNLIGEDAVESFKDLNKIPFHRYAMYVEIFNSEEKRQEFKQLALHAYTNKEITYAQYLIVSEMKDAKQASALMAYYQQQEEKKKMAEQAMIQQRAIELDDRRTANKIKVDDNEYQWKERIANTEGDWRMRSYQAPANAALQKKQMDIDNNQQRQQEHADAMIKVKNAEKSIVSQTPLPVGGTEAAAQLSDVLSA